MPTKPNLPIQTKSNLAYQAYWTKPTKPKLLVKAVNAWVRSANVCNIWKWLTNEWLTIFKRIHKALNGCLDPSKIMFEFWKFLLIARRLAQFVFLINFICRWNEITSWGKKRSILLFSKLIIRKSQVFSTRSYVYLHSYTQPGLNRANRWKDVRVFVKSLIFAPKG